MFAVKLWYGVNAAVSESFSFKQSCCISLQQHHYPTFPLTNVIFTLVFNSKGRSSWLKVGRRIRSGNYTKDFSQTVPFCFSFSASIQLDPPSSKSRESVESAMRHSLGGKH